MGDVVDTIPIPTKDDLNFLSDMARFSEGLAGWDEAALRRKYRLTDTAWEKMGADDDLVRAITEEKTRRLRSGQQKRERAQAFAVDVPAVAAAIAFDTNANPRHRLDAGALIDKLAANGPEAANVDSTRFVIQINLGSDTERYSKSFKIDPDDRDPFNDIDSTNVVAAIAVKKPEGGGHGEPI